MEFHCWSFHDHVTCVWYITLLYSVHVYFYNVQLYEAISCCVHIYWAIYIGCEIFKPYLLRLSSLFIAVFPPFPYFYLLFLYIIIWKTIKELKLEFLPAYNFYIQYLLRNI